MLTVIDKEEKIEELIPHLDTMVEEGLIAMSRIEGHSLFAPPGDRAGDFFRKSAVTDVEIREKFDKITAWPLCGFPKCQVVSKSAKAGMLTVCQGCDAVISQPCRATPNDHVAMHEGNANRLVSPLQSAKQESGR